MTLAGFSLRRKVFLAIASSTMSTVLLMAALVALGMRDGFSRYLLDAELNRFDPLVTALAEKHDARAPGWPEFLNEPLMWKDYVRDHWQGESADRPLVDGNNNPLQPAGSGDDLQIGQRVFLLDASQQPIVVGQNYSRHAATRPIYSNPDNPQGQPIGWLGMSLPQTERSDSSLFYLDGQFRALIVATLISMAVAMLVSVLLSRQLLAPIRKLIQGSRVLAQGTYSARIESDRSDELGLLIEHYNQLAQSLELSAESERRWISDTSHELQTPLAVLQAQIEALQDGIRPANAQTLEALHKSVRQLSRLVQDLKVLSFDREGRLVVQKRTVDLGEIISDATDAIAPKLAQLDIRLHCPQTDERLIEADTVRIRQVLDNLLENAARYTYSGGRICMSIEDLVDQYRIVVEDTEPCPDPDDLPKLFDRFFRQEASRSRDTGGSGLGLSICRAIVVAHGGDIQVEPSDLGGLKISLELKKG